MLRSNALAFQLLTAVVPFTFFCVGVAGFLGLRDEWSSGVAPDLQRQVSPAAFSLIDSTVVKVLSEKQVFWMTVGLAVAIWQLSRSVRTGSLILDALDGREEHRSRRELIPLSLKLAAGVAACVVGALLIAGIAPLAYGDVPGLAAFGLGLVRYLAAGGLLLAAVGLVVHFGPLQDRPIAWVSVGAVLITVCWLVVTAGFGFYMKAVASYGSVYGALVTFVALLTWVYLSALAFSLGAATDAVLRDA